MTREETVKILMIIQAAYPNYKPQDKTIAVNVWFEMLGDIPYEQVSTAIKAYIQTDKSGFAPSIGDIRDKVQSIFSDTQELNETSAWSMVWKAICNSGYHAEEEFAKLPPVIQKAVHSPAQLREWALLENIDGKTITVLQSDFQRTFRAELQRERERGKLSTDVVKLMKPLNNPRISNKPKELSVRDQRMILESNAHSAPNDLKERVLECFREESEEI